MLKSTAAEAVSACSFARSDELTTFREGGRLPRAIRRRRLYLERFVPRTAHRSPDFGDGKGGVIALANAMFFAAPQSESLFEETPAPNCPSHCGKGCARRLPSEKV